MNITDDVERVGALANYLAWVDETEGHKGADRAIGAQRREFLHLVLADLEERFLRLLRIDVLPSEPSTKEEEAYLCADFHLLADAVGKLMGYGDGSVYNAYQEVRAELLGLPGDREAGEPWLAVRRTDGMQEEGHTNTLTGTANAEFDAPDFEDIDISRYATIEVTAVSVRTLRETLGLTRRRFARILGTSHISVARWEDETDPAETDRQVSRPSGKFLTRMWVLAADYGLAFNPASDSPETAVHVLAVPHPALTT